MEQETIYIQLPTTAATVLQLMQLCSTSSMGSELCSKDKPNGFFLLWNCLRDFCIIDGQTDRQPDSHADR